MFCQNLITLIYEALKRRLNSLDIRTHYQGLLMRLLYIDKFYYFNITAMNYSNTHETNIERLWLTQIRLSK